MQNRIFLGGTCAKTTWRDEIIANLNPSIQFFNPVVEDWTPAHIEIENDEKKNKCNIHLYVITKEMTGVYSIAEVIESCTTNKIVIFHVIPDGFDKAQLKSLQAVVDMASQLGAIAYIDHRLLRTITILNMCFSNYGED